MLCPVLSQRTVLPAYALSDTVTSHDDITLCACHALSGTDIAYLPMRCPVLTERICLRACYALSGTDIAHHHQASKDKRTLLFCDAVQTSRVVYRPTRSLCHVRY
eukprot:547604-Rhodomonas_salina.1